MTDNNDGTYTFSYSMIYAGNFSVQVLLMSSGEVYQKHFSGTTFSGTSTANWIKSGLDFSDTNTTNFWGTATTSISASIVTELLAPSSDLFTLYILWDDGCELYFGGSLIASRAWNSGGSSITSFQYLTAGKYYSYNVRWCQSSGTYGLSTKWSYTGVSNVTIPNSSLYLSTLVSSTPFNIQISSVCADGYRTKSEGCDDSNKINGDGCSSTWTIESGWGWYGGYEVSKDSCEVWGDGIRFSPLAWDDGNSVGGDGWSSTWLTEIGANYIWSGGNSTTKDTWEVWGDGFRMGAANWDDGNRNFGDGWDYFCNVESGWTWSGGTTTSKDVCAEIWGDGKRFNSNTTYCDDGNKTSNDGCDSAWTKEIGWIWSGGNSLTKDTCSDIWGDGKKYSSSSTFWDDANNVSGDGCSSTWSIESGWNCSGGSSSDKDTWTEIWGDGTRFNSVSTYCDDGNSLNGDGCSSTWSIETGWTCSGGTSTLKDTCKDICGDGKKYTSSVSFWEDGNSIKGDGCDSNWAVETGYTCTGGTPSTLDTWFETWGDGIRYNSVVSYCDDGNIVSNDGCDSNWSIEVGWIWSGGNASSKDICLDICGDGKKYTSAALFWDDGNKVAGDGCSPTWSFETGYEWFGGSSTSKDACSEIWGDGIRFNSNSTYCDDGNIIDGDGCNKNWEIEIGWICTIGNSTTKDTCTDIWGDGMHLTKAKSFWEDGNKINGDGWNNNCSFETGWTWSGGTATIKDTWTEICGDGIRFHDNSTYCDDGNLINGDGWSSLWEVEYGFRCDGKILTSKSICIKVLTVTAQEAAAAQSTQAAVGAGASVSAGASLLSMSSPVAIFSMVNQFQLMYFLIVSGVYLSDGVFNIITGMSFSMFDFDFIKIEKIRIFEIIYECLAFEQPNTLLNNIGITSGSTFMNMLKSILILCILI